MFNIIIITICIVVDRISKIIVVFNMNALESNTIIKNFFSLTYAKNYGAAWSMMDGKTSFLILVAILASIFIVYYFIKNKDKINKYEKVSMALILGGTLGNLIDRIIYGYVIDFLDFKIFNYNFPIFNVADSCIVIGALILFLSGMGDKKNGTNKSNSK